MSFLLGQLQEVVFTLTAFTCLYINKVIVGKYTKSTRGLPLSTYALKGRGGDKFPIRFHCVLHAKGRGRGPDSM